MMAVHLGAVVQLIVGLVYTGPFRSYGQLLILNAGGTAKDGAPIGPSPWWQ
jgi:septal ring factor EnvC (AmiA/AmiB activator)